MTSIADCRKGPPGQRQRAARAATSAVARRVVVLAVHHVDVAGDRLTGGAEKYLLDTIDALLEAGADVHVGFSGTNIYIPLLRYWGPNRLCVECVGWINDELHGDDIQDTATVSARMSWLAARRAGTVFVVQQASGAAFCASVVAAHCLGLRVVSTIRQCAAPLAPPGRLGRWSFWRRRAISRVRTAAIACERVIFNSRRVADEYIRTYRLPRERCDVIYNGEVPRPCALPTEPDSPRKIVSVGRVTHAKGADVLFGAFARLAGQHPDVNLIYHGDGPMRQEIAERALAEGLADRVQLRGYEANRERVFACMDICVQVSRRESLSNSVLEAMARGIPCIVSDVGGMPELLEDGVSGLIVPAEDGAALADAISVLLTDRRRYEAFSIASVERVASLFERNQQRRKTVAAILGIPVAAAR